MPECDDAPVLFCMGGGLAFQDLSRRLQHDINRANRKRVSSVVFVGEHASWVAAARAGLGNEADWIPNASWPSPEASQIVARMRRKL